MDHLLENDRAAPVDACAQRVTQERGPLQRAKG